MSFGGATYDPALDRARLAKQSQDVFVLMFDGQWRTLQRISELTGYPEASISARLRDFRKPKFGGHIVERQRARERGGLYRYRLIISTGGPQSQ